MPDLPPYHHSLKIEQSFKCVFDTYKIRVYRYALALSHSSYAAEEITQEIFVKLWLCRDVLTGIENMEAYLFTMTRNRTLNHIRKISHHQAALKKLQDAMRPVSNDVAEKAAANEIDELLQQALVRLSPQRRKVYLLSRREGLNFEQIALQLQLSQHTVKNHLVEALKVIRRFLEAGSACFFLLSWLMA